MVSPELLEILRCPQDKTPLTEADAALIARLNGEVKAKRLVNVGGGKVEKPIDGGLVRQAGDLLYPVIDRIPVMLPDEAIRLHEN